MSLTVIVGIRFKISEGRFQKEKRRQKEVGSRKIAEMRIQE
jgi:hypothetical protein